MSLRLRGSAPVKWGLNAAKRSFPARWLGGSGVRTSVAISCVLVFWALAVVCAPAGKLFAATQHDQKADLPEGFAIDLKASEADVLKAVELVTQDTVLHGTQVYSREDELTETEAATASAYFGPWAGPGHAFYKVRKKAISPQDFKNGTDIGTIAVRYVILGVAPDRTHLQI